MGINAGAYQLKYALILLVRDLRGRERLRRAWPHSRTGWCRLRRGFHCRHDWNQTKKTLPLLLLTESPQVTCLR